MDTKHRKQIADEESFFLERLNPDAQFLANEYTKLVLKNTAQMEQVEAEGNRTAKISKFVLFAQRSGKNGFNYLLMALKTTGPEHIPIMNRLLGIPEKPVSINFDLVYAALGEPRVDLHRQCFTFRPDHMTPVMTDDEAEVGVLELIPAPYRTQWEQRLHVDSVYDIGLGQRGMRGRAICINMATVSGRPRTGSGQDVKMLKKLFQSPGLKFEFKSYNDLTKNELEKALEAEAKRQEIKDIRVLFVLVMSHGETGVFKTSDGESFKISDLVSAFDKKKCPALKGRPKVFCIQACQQTEKGREEFEFEKEGKKLEFEVPITSTSDDAFISIAALPGEKAERLPELGTRYMLNLCDVIARYAKETHIQELLTLTGYRVKKATEEEQNPYLIQTAVKKLYLCPGL